MPEGSNGGREKRGSGRPGSHRSPSVEDALSQEPFDPTYGYGEGGYYNERGSWYIPGPHTGQGPRQYQRTDARILVEVCDRLTIYGQLDARKIKVSVKSGEVTLQGTVNSRGEKWAAEDIAESVWGVKDVHNRLRIAR
jgi:osmotically-inducible protein OsmY